MVFIDTIHSYLHTLEEIRLSSKLTVNILLDDANFVGNDFDIEPGGVKRAIKEWLMERDGLDWNRTDWWDGHTTLLSHK